MAWYRCGGGSRYTPVSLVPVMSSNSQDGYTASASSEFDSGYQAYMAFDGGTSQVWAPLNISGPHWVQISMPSAKRATRFIITTRSGTYYATSVTVKGSNNGTDFIDLGSASNMSSGSTANVFNSSVSAFSTYRFVIDNYGLAEIYIEGIDESQPTLITKRIMQNGTYNAVDDSADGYSSVTVDVEGGSSGTPFICSDAKQYFALPNIYGDDDYRYEFKLIVPSEQQTLIFGGNWNVGSKLLHVYGSNMIYYMTNSPTQIPYTCWDIMDIEASTTYIKVNGTSYTSTSQARGHELIYLFGFSFGYKSSIGISEFKIYDNSDDSLVMDLVPMKNSSTGAGYFHDTIGDDDYYSESGYDFAYVTFDGGSELVTKSITANGTYNAIDDGVDGYSSVEVNTLPSSLTTDPWGIASLTSKSNFRSFYSDYTVKDSQLVEEIVAYLYAGSGYEGFCFSVPSSKYELTDGGNYILTFTLDVGEGIDVTGASYEFGVKHTTSVVSSFNTTADQSFVRQGGSQNVSFPFTAGSSNYFSILCSNCSQSSRGYIRVINPVITEAT